MSSELEAQIEQAATTGNVELLDALITKWQTQNELNGLAADGGDLNFALHTAISANQLGAVACLLRRGATLDAECAHTARRANAPLDMYQLFLVHGWDVDCKNATGRPFLHSALDDEHLVRFLLANGANPNAISDRWQTTTLDVAAQKQPVSVMKLLLDHGAEISAANPLHSAAACSTQRDQSEMMAFLLDRGIDINAISTFGHRMSKRDGDENGTPLHAAIRSGYEDRIRFLLDRGADPDVKTERGDTALDYAKRWNFETGIRILQERSNTS